MQVSVHWFHDINNNMDKININAWQTFHIGLCPTRLHNRTFSNCSTCSRTLCMQRANTFFATQQSDIGILTTDPIAADYDKQIGVIASKSSRTKHNRIRARASFSEHNVPNLNLLSTKLKWQTCNGMLQSRHLRHRFIEFSLLIP